jgi:hypothetical protein
MNDRGSEQISHPNGKKRRKHTFGDNASARIVGKGIISLDNGKTKTHNVLYVEGLKHDFLSVIQMLIKVTTSHFILKDVR